MIGGFGNSQSNVCLVGKKNHPKKIFAGLQGAGGDKRIWETPHCFFGDRRLTEVAFGFFGVAFGVFAGSAGRGAYFFSGQSPRAGEKPPAVWGFADRYGWETGNGTLRGKPRTMSVYGVGNPRVGTEGALLCETDGDFFHFVCAGAGGTD